MTYPTPSPSPGPARAEARIAELESADMVEFGRSQIFARLLR